MQMHINPSPSYRQKTGVGMGSKCRVTLSYKDSYIPGCLGKYQGVIACGFKLAKDLKMLSKINFSSATIIDKFSNKNSEKCQICST
jgi:hypothetical protein